MTQLVDQALQEEFSPREPASAWSLLNYSYVTPLVRLAYNKTSLKVGDLPTLPENEKAERVISKAIPVRFERSSGVDDS